jgi:hypothetical protein
MCPVASCPRNSMYLVSIKIGGRGIRIGVPAFRRFGVLEVGLPVDMAIMASRFRRSS